MDRDDWREAHSTAILASCWSSKALSADECRIDWLKNPPPKHSLEDRLKFAFMANDAYWSTRGK